MTILGKLFTLFPLIYFTLILGHAYFLLKYPTVFNLCCLLLAVYLYPLICYRLLVLVKPVKEGMSNILSRTFSPWFAAHQLQLPFIALPWLEGILRIIPGVYSLWLRAWGSKIGKNVYWTPGVSVYDRNLLNVGDHVVFGERSNTVSHVITPRKGKAILYVQKITIGDNAFIGAGSTLSPGCVVENNVLIKASSDLYPNTRVSKEGIKRENYQWKTGLEI